MKTNLLLKSFLPPSSPSFHYLTLSTLLRSFTTLRMGILNENPHDIRVNALSPVYGKRFFYTFPPHWPVSVASTVSRSNWRHVCVVNAKHTDKVIARLNHSHCVGSPRWVYCHLREIGAYIWPGSVASRNGRTSPFTPFRAWAEGFTERTKMKI